MEILSYNMNRGEIDDRLKILKWKQAKHFL